MRRIFVPWALVLTVFSTNHVLAQPAAAMSASAQQRAARLGAAAGAHVLSFDGQKESHALDRLAVAA